MPPPTPPNSLPTDVSDAARLAAAHDLATEWVLTNGLGGFAMGTVLGVPTRRYHGCLIAALSPPVRRVLALGPVAETLILDPAGPADTDPRAEHLQLFDFADAEVHPSTDPRLTRFERTGAGSCRWVYEFDAPRAPGAASPTARVTFERTLTLADGRNAASIGYEACAGGGSIPFRIELRPLTPMRDMHELGAPDGGPPELTRAWTDDAGGACARIATREATLTLRCLAEGAPARFDAEPHSWKRIRYAWESARGLDAIEDAHAPGVFVIESAGQPVRAQLDASVEKAGDTGDPVVAEAHARDGRRRAMVNAIRHVCGPTDDARARILARLACAADDFVVRSSAVGADGRSIIAGYPWFADWGRDSMIALPGLLLVTGRTEEAFGVLETFGNARQNGLIPNRFDDDAGPAHYNTADASLWYIHACAQWFAATGDRGRFFDALAPACAEIIEAHTQGTDYRIGADPADGLMRAGDAKTQLTWMDARRDGVTFTPRHGKPVEINALWHNALVSLTGAFEGDRDEAVVELRARAGRVATSFRASFLGGPAGGLVDCLTPDGSGGWEKSAELRPNQIFAASLPHSPLDAADTRHVVAAVREHLLTPVGLRTLASEDPGYRARFEGTLFDRDAAYHNGTVWPWLLGPYVEGMLRSEGFSASARGRALELLDRMASELDHQGVGQIWEVYDADEPRRPDGCIAQAWSVAELLRGYTLAMGTSGR